MNSTDRMMLDLRAVFKLFPPKFYYTVEAVDLDERVQECLEMLRGYMACKKDL